MENLVLVHNLFFQLISSQAVKYFFKINDYISFYGINNVNILLSNLLNFNIKPIIMNTNFKNSLVILIFWILFNEAKHVIKEYSLFKNQEHFW